VKGRDHLRDLDVVGDNIITDFKEIVCKGVDWIHLVQNRNGFFWDIS
jgi:hypothetical protein